MDCPRPSAHEVTVCPPDRGKRRHPEPWKKAPYDARCFDLKMPGADLGIEFLSGRSASFSPRETQVIILKTGHGHGPTKSD